MQGDGEATPARPPGRIGFAGSDDRLNPAFVGSEFVRERLAAEIFLAAQLLDLRVGKP